ncbi:polysaccharide deacetylase [Breznakibacter xylanolyticus]|uniref:Polysaccharide deacetylase n=2 Tax=Breznakibacter xylanolyticus TaxID=990 RepID=A0A2W7NE24_9BACT|nr:polysaccharide deacetylase family protein [Breznakibacter xylanolyticus]PZX14994.1 polysaccharide deacetylase [Breznakibacter xylanolyticus]
MRYILPFYHVVSDETLPHLKHLYRVKSVREFEHDLDYLCRHYEPVTLDAFIRFGNNGFQDVRRPIMHLTFDDGLRECAKVISPILKQKGIPATFFINSDFVDNRAMMFRLKASVLIDALFHISPLSSTHDEIGRVLCCPKKRIIATIQSLKYSDAHLIDAAALVVGIDFNDWLTKHQPYLNADELRQLVHDGFDIGSHSVDHPEFRYLPIDEQVSQLTVSVAALQQMIGTDVRSFSFPFTDYQVSKHFFDTIYANKMVDVTFGTAGMKEDVIEKNYQRIAMETKWGVDFTLAFQRLKWMGRSMIGVNHIRRS